MNLQDIVNKLTAMVVALKALLSQKTQGQVLFETAESFIGKDASPLDKAADAYGCAETVNEIHQTAFGKPIGGDVSTTRMYSALINSTRFYPVGSPMPGDIVISPTGYGNGKMKNGHVGIVGTRNRIMSNSSASGTWEYNYTIDSWTERYGVTGGFPVALFRIK